MRLVAFSKKIADTAQHIAVPKAASSPIRCMDTDYTDEHVVWEEETKFDKDRICTYL